MHYGGANYVCTKQQVISVFFGFQCLAVYEFDGTNGSSVHALCNLWWDLGAQVQKNYKADGLN